MLYCSLADDSIWFDTWPGVKEQPHHMRPIRLTQGDNTDFTKEEKKLFLEVQDKAGLPIQWKTGDVLMFCNVR